MIKPFETLNVPLPIPHPPSYSVVTDILPLLLSFLLLLLRFHHIGVHSYLMLCLDLPTFELCISGILLIVL